MIKKFSIKEINDIAKDVLSKANKANTSGATVIALHGDLGAGKTTLSQEIAKVLQVKENVISPTFVILKNYEIKNEKYKWKKLVHIDAYRLNHSDELLKLGWQEILKNKENIVIVEWPENVPDCFDQKVCHVHLEHIDEGMRSIEFK